MTKKRKVRAAAAPGTTPRRDLLMLPVDRAVACEVSLDYHLTLEAIYTGHGSEYHLGSIAQAVFTTMLLSRTMATNVPKRLFPEAKEAVLRCRRAGLATGVWSADLEAYRIFGEILTLFDEQLAVVPLRELKIANEQLFDVFNAVPMQRKQSAMRRETPAQSDAND